MAEGHRPGRRAGKTLLRLAGWKASRWGLRGELLDPVTSRPGPALAVVNALLNHIREALGDVVADAANCTVWAEAD